MFALVAAALAATAIPPVQPQVRQARATVRIMVSARLRFAELEKSDPKQFRETMIRGPNGAAEPARLIEFQ